MNRPQVSVVVPLYNESEAFPFLIDRLSALLEKLPFAIEIVLADDGSQDDTALLIQQKAKADGRFQGLLLARHYGHQIALSAGIAAARAQQAIMVIDADLQDPPELLETFLGYIQQGYDVVYGISQKRAGENWFKILTAKVFYRMLNAITHVPIPNDSGDFCMISRKVADILNQMPEKRRFLRGLRAWVGFRQKGILYEREQRIAGKTKYNLRKMLRLASIAFLGFSNWPVRVVSLIGLLTLLPTLGYGFWHLFLEPESPFPLIFFTVLLYAGIQLMALGLLGEYLLRIKETVDARPNYLVAQRVVERRPTNHPFIPNPEPQASTTREEE